jgi:thiamine pyrophosphate-dependent acetolactate synthase large subunit-like protein
MRELGLTTVFGNPGTTEVPFLADWPEDFRYVLGLQESAVVAMAAGFAQLSGTPVLVDLHSAGGVGHGMGSVFTAYRNRTPMIVLAGQQARALLPGQPFLGATDATLSPVRQMEPRTGPVRRRAGRFASGLRWLPIRARHAGFLTTAGGALGYGLPAAVGAALARPERTVVAVVGDGSVMYSIQTLWTAARERVPLTVVILDNAEYAAVWLLGQAAGAGKLPGTALGGLDFVRLAEGMSCAARRVDDAGELAPALTAALAAPEPTLLHVPLAPDVTPPY